MHSAVLILSNFQLSLKTTYIGTCNNLVLCNLVILQFQREKNPLFCLVSFLSSPTSFINSECILEPPSTFQYYKHWGRGLQLVFYPSFKKNPGLIALAIQSNLNCIESTV